MKNNYLVRKTNSEEYGFFVTVLDEKANIEDISKEIIKKYGIVDKNILIDTLLVNGTSNYRFIERHSLGFIYVFPDEDVVKEANKQYVDYPVKLDSSRLPNVSSKEILGKDFSKDVRLYHMKGW